MLTVSAIGVCTVIANTKLSKAAKEIIKAEMPLGDAIIYFRQHVIQEALTLTKGNKSQAARLLHTRRSTLIYKPKWMN